MSLGTELNIFHDVKKKRNQLKRLHVYEQRVNVAKATPRYNFCLFCLRLGHIFSLVGCETELCVGSWGFVIF